MTNPTLEPSSEGPQPSAPGAPTYARASSVEILAYTCAVDLCGESSQAIALAKGLVKDVRKSGLKSPFAEALLRRLALAEWTKRDRPRPSRLESKDPKETAILLFFLKAWGAGYEDLGAALSVSEDRAHHLVHKARMEQVATLTRIPIPKADCRRPRELLSDYHENRLAQPLAEDVAQHIKDCRECSALSAHLRTVLDSPARPLLDPPVEMLSARETRPTLALALDQVSRGQRRAGIVLLVAGIVLGVVELHPGLNASAAAQLDRMSATFSRWRGRGERFAEDLRVLKALAVGTIEGRTEELSQTLDEYVNSGDSPDSSNPKNKPSPDAVLDSREPKAMPQGAPSPRPAESSLSPKNPS